MLRELVVALGGALFFGNLLALLRRRADGREAARASVTRSRPGSPVRGLGHAPARTGDLPQAPVPRSVAYLVVGFLVMAWGIASIVTG